MQTRLTESVEELADLVASMPTTDEAGEEFDIWHAACWEASTALWEAGENQDPAALSAVLPQLGSAIAAVPYQLGGQLALIGGAFVESGADPLPLMRPVFQRLLPVLADCADLISAWPEPTSEPDAADPTSNTESDREAKEELLPDADSQAGAQEAYDQLVPQMGHAAAFRVAMAWHSARGWAKAGTTLLQRRVVRDAVRDRDELIAASQALREWRGDVNLLAMLLRVLDDEPIIVLHRHSGRGFRVKIGGIGDNFQLHTLLAAHLIGSEQEGLLPYGTRPSRTQIAAATTGEPYAAMAGAFNLVDATGAWIFNEGVPADIPFLDDRRVIVLDPEPYTRTWTTGRTFPAMTPIFIVEQALPDSDARTWLAKVAAAETYNGAYTT